jgi:hypothetical protein
LASRVISQLLNVVQCWLAGVYDPIIRLFKEFALTEHVWRGIIRPSRIVAQLRATFTMADHEFATLPVCEDAIRACGYISAQETS